MAEDRLWPGPYHSLHQLSFLFVLKVCRDFVVLEGRRVVNSRIQCLPVMVSLYPRVGFVLPILCNCILSNSKVRLFSETFKILLSFSGNDFLRTVTKTRLRSAEAYGNFSSLKLSSVERYSWRRLGLFRKKWTLMKDMDKQSRSYKTMWYILIKRSSRKHSVPTKVGICG